MINETPHLCHRQQGVAAVEFALIASVFFTLLIGIMEMGRLLFYWNTAVEATRLGARIAVVCDKDASQIKSKMNALFPTISSSDISVSYLPDACTASTCTSVTVSIGSSVSIATYIPFVPLSLTLPQFATTLTRESMSSASNPVCG